MKRKGGFFRFIILVIDLALAVWIFSAYQKTRDKDPKESAAPTTQAPTKPKATTQASTRPAQTTPAPTTKEPATQPPATPAPTTKAASVPAQTASEMARFAWYLDGVMTNGVPSGSAQITEAHLLLGRWKALLYHDPDGPRANMVFADVLADAGQNGNVAAYEEYLSYSPLDGTEAPITVLDAPVYPFTAENGLVAVDIGSGTVYLYFYEYNGSQYASGAFMTSGGDPVFIALTR